jgi:hypothetical protein
MLILNVVIVSAAENESLGTVEDYIERDGRPIEEFQELAGEDKNEVWETSDNVLYKNALVKKLATDISQKRYERSLAGGAQSMAIERWTSDAIGRLRDHGIDDVAGFKLEDLSFDDIKALAKEAGVQLDIELSTKLESVKGFGDPALRWSDAGENIIGDGNVWLDLENLPQGVSEIEYKGGKFILRYEGGGEIVIGKGVIKGLYVYLDAANVESGMPGDIESKTKARFFPGETGKVFVETDGNIYISGDARVNIGGIDFSANDKTSESYVRLEEDGVYATRNTLALFKSGNAATPSHKETMVILNEGDFSEQYEQFVQVVATETASEVYMKGEHIFLKLNEPVIELKADGEGLMVDNGYYKLRFDNDETFIDRYSQESVAGGYEINAINLQKPEQRITMTEKSVSFEYIGDREALLTGIYVKEEGEPLGTLGTLGHFIASKRPDILGGKAEIGEIDPYTGKRVTYKYPRNIYLTGVHPETGEKVVNGVLVYWNGQTAEWRFDKLDINNDAVQTLLHGTLLTGYKFAQSDENLGLITELYNMYQRDGGRGSVAHVESVAEQRNGFDKFYRDVHMQGVEVTAEGKRIPAADYKSFGFDVPIGIKTSEVEQETIPEYSSEQVLQFQSNLEGRNWVQIGGAAKGITTELLQAGARGEDVKPLSAPLGSDPPGFDVANVHIYADKNELESVISSLPAGLSDAQVIQGVKDACVSIRCRTVLVRDVPQDMIDENIGRELSKLNLPRALKPKVTSFKTQTLASLNGQGVQQGTTILSMSGADGEIIGGFFSLQIPGREPMTLFLPKKVIEEKIYEALGETPLHTQGILHMYRNR